MIQKRIFCLIQIVITCILGDKCCLEDSNKTFKDNNLLVLIKFKYFEQLKFNCLNPINISIWAIEPDDKIILSNSLNMTGLKIQPLEHLFGIFFYNLKGFDLKSNPFKKVEFIGYKINRIYLIRFSNFDFYDKNQSVNSICNENLFNGFLPENQFNGFMLALEDSTIFSTNTCPIIFTNLKLKILNIDKICSSFIEKNLLEFQELSSNLMNTINSNIYQFQIKIYHAELNTKLLNRHIFKDLNVLDLNGQISKIQEDLFKELTNLRFLRIRTQNIQHILIRNNKWLNFINYNVNIDPNDSKQVNNYIQKIFVLIIYQTFHNLTFYNYPEQDFCYFKSFPHNKLVLPRLKPNYKTSCSCTEIFLIQYSAKFSELITFYSDYFSRNYYLIQYYHDVIEQKEFSHCVNESFLMILKKCNFNARLELCDVKIVEKQKESYFYINDWDLLSKYSHLILSVYLNSVFSIISIVFSLLILVGLSGKVMPKEMNKMYTFLKINTLFNILFIIIRLFKLIDFCPNADLICISRTQKSESVQYFKIIFVKIIGNVFQSASNLTHCTYTLSRYISVSNNKSYLTFIHKISYLKYLIGILLFSFIINIHIYFEYSIYKTSVTLNQLKPFDVKGFNLEYRQDKFDDYKEYFSKSEHITILNVVQYVKLIFSDVSYILISFLIDLFLLSFVRKKMLKKEQVIASFVVDLNRVVLDGADSNRRTQNVIEDNKKKKIIALKNRITFMIVLNGINFLIFRLPLAVWSFYGFIFRFDNQAKKYKPNMILYIVCRYFRFCSSLKEFFYFIYLNSFIIQFFIFYKVDKNFKASLKNIKAYLKTKIFRN
jgi:hypothetical protein